MNEEKLRSFPLQNAHMAEAGLSHVMKIDAGAAVSGAAFEQLSAVVRLELSRCLHRPTRVVMTGVQHRCWRTVFMCSGFVPARQRSRADVVVGENETRSYRL